MGISWFRVWQLTPRVANLSERLATLGVLSDYNQDNGSDKNGLASDKERGRQTVPICRPARRKEGASFVLPNDYEQYTLSSLTAH
jgi:hypothetical protein